MTNPDEWARALVVADQLARRESEREEFTNRILAYGREERRRVWEEAARQLDAINQPSRIGIMHRLRTLAAQWRHDAVSHE